MLPSGMGHSLRVRNVEGLCLLAGRRFLDIGAEEDAISLRPSFNALVTSGR